MTQQETMNTYETVDDMLYALGSNKEDTKLTWSGIANRINDEFDLSFNGDYYRKRYGKLNSMTSYTPPALSDPDFSLETKLTLYEQEKQRMRIQAENRKMRKVISQEATFDSICEMLQDLVPQAREIKRPEMPAEEPEYAVYAMLSDIHYGLKFDTFYGKYDTDIAEQRVMRYAEEIVRIGETYHASTCYVSLMGDLISGQGHTTIKLENSSPVTEQYAGVCVLVCAFLERLREAFPKVVVNSVSGNHSRLDPNLENTLRTERMDALVPFYAKGYFRDTEGIEWRANEYDATIASLEIMNKRYVAVHGDLDINKNESSMRIRDAIGHVDYFLMGHMHVPETRLENVGYIRNGAVISGGDDYTMRKRLFAPAYQTCMVVGKDGVKAICPVKLSGEEGA